MQETRYAASDKMLCPFLSTPDAYIPAFCNIVQAGSRYDLTIGSVTTSANERFVGTDATNPVVMNYAVNIKPYTASGAQVPASGSAMAYLKAHVQESRDCFACKAEDLTYSETASARGSITAFNKEMSYSSQVTGPLPTMIPVPLPDAGDSQLVHSCDILKYTLFSRVGNTTARGVRSYDLGEDWGKL